MRKIDCLILVSSQIVRISKIIRKNSKIKWQIYKNRIEKFEIKFFFFFKKATKSKRTEYQAMLNAFSRETIYIYMYIHTVKARLIRMLATKSPHHGSDETEGNGAHRQLLGSV